MLAAAAVRGDGAPVALPPGRWRDVLGGDELERGGAVPFGRYGIALLERA